MRPEQQRVKQLLTEAIKLLCRNSLQFKEDVTVEGLLGITLDKSDIFLVSINETIQQTFREGAVFSQAEKRNTEDSLDGHTPKKRRRRRGSREGSSSPPPSPSGQTDSQQSDPSTEISDRVNVKSEKTGDDPEGGRHPDDGRQFNPAHDSTSEPPPDNKALIQKHPDFPVATLTPAQPADEGDTGQVQVKQEVEEDEEDCYLVDSDSQDTSDATHPMQGEGSSMGSHSWASTGADQAGFNLSELDMISAANFQQQFGNLAMGGGANNMGNMTWDASQMQGQGQPSTSGTQDGSQRFRMPRPRKALISPSSVGSNNEGNASDNIGDSSSDESPATSEKKKESKNIQEAPVLELPMSFLRSVEMAVSLQGMQTPESAASTSIASLKAGTSNTQIHDSPQASEGSDGDIVRRLVSLQEIVEWMHNVLNNVSDTTHKIQYLLEMSDRRPGVRATEGFFPQLEKLPLKTLDELKALESELEGNQELQTVLTNALAVVGGDNLQKTARNVMELALTNSLQRECNWEGKQSWKTHARKFAFGGTHLAAIMTQAVHANEVLKNATTSQIHSALKIYLRNAADRCGGRRERQKIKETSADDSADQSQGSLSNLSFTPPSYSISQESPVQTRRKSNSEKSKESSQQAPPVELPPSFLSSVEMAVQLTHGMQAAMGKATAAVTKPASKAAPKMDSRRASESKDVDIIKMLSSLQQAVEWMNNVLSNVAETTQRIQYLLEMSERRPLRMCEGSYPQIDKLPLKTMEELKMLELDLGGNQELQAALTQALSTAGGDTLQKTARNVMNMALCNSLQRECNWEGKLSWKSSARKYAFGGTKLAHVMTQAIHANELIKVTTSQIQKALKIYLRNAADRGGGRRHRQKVKEQMQLQNVSQNQNRFDVGSGQNQFDMPSNQNQFGVSSSHSQFDVSNNQSQFASNQNQCVQ